MLVWFIWKKYFLTVWYDHTKSTEGWFKTGGLVGPAIRRVESSTPGGGGDEADSCSHEYKLFHPGLMSGWRPAQIMRG